MTNLKKLLEDVCINLKDRGEKIYHTFDPEVKVDDEEKKFRMKEKYIFGRLIEIYMIVTKKYYPEDFFEFNSEYFR